MATIPTNGEDPWGDEIRAFLLAHTNADGSLKASAVTTVTNPLYDASGAASAVQTSLLASLAAAVAAVPEQARDALGAALTAGANITITPSDGSDTITIAVSGLTSGSLSDFAEAVRDRVGTTLVAGANVTITVDDTGDTITIAAAGGGGGGATTAAAVTMLNAGTEYSATQLQDFVEETDARFAAEFAEAVAAARTGVALLPAITNVIAASSTDVTRNTTAAESDLIALVIEHGFIVPGCALEYVFSGDLLSNSGSPTFTFKVKLGGTTILDTGATAVAVDSNRRKWECRGTIYLPDVAHEETTAGLWVTAPAAGSTALVSGLQFGAEVGATEDFTSADKTLKMTVQMSVSNAAVETVCKRAVVRRVTPAA